MTRTCLNKARSSEPLASSSSVRKASPKLRESGGHLLLHDLEPVLDVLVTRPVDSLGSGGDGPALPDVTAATFMFFFSGGRSPKPPGPRRAGGGRLEQNGFHAILVGTPE